MILSTEIIIFLIIFVIGVILFALEWFPADITAPGLMLALILFGLIEPEDAFAGFGSNTVLMIFGLLILVETLIHTGLVDIIGQRLLLFIGTSPARLFGITLVVPAAMSAFMSNTASTAFFLPIIPGLSRRSQISSSRLLMPLAFATILAGSVTLIGSSTNMVVSGLMQQYGLEPLGIFELTPVGLPILIAGLIYMATVGQRLIPDRSKTDESDNTLLDELYFTEITIPSNSSFAGRTIDESGLIHQLQLGMLSLQREKKQLKPLADTVLAPGDILIVEGTREHILSLNHVSGIEISGKIQQLDDYAQNGAVHTAEVVILPGSPLIRQTVKGLGLRDRYQMQILAVSRAGELRHTKIGRMVFRVGDVLLIKIPRENLRLLESERAFRILDLVETRQIDMRKVFLSTSIFVGTMLLAVSGVLPITVAVLCGALLVFLTRCITPAVAYRNIEWRVLILIGSMLAFGQAMQTTGTADFLAELIVQFPAMNSPLPLLCLFFGLALFLTQLMSNQAAAAVLLPIAIQTAALLDYNPRTFAIMVTLAASASFITPLEPACALVYSAGRYKFMDFVRAGSILALIVFVIAILLVPLIWTV